MAFREEQALQKRFYQAEANKQLLVYSFDAATFTTIPCVPYAWQKKSETIELPSQRSKRLNVLAFMNKNNDLFYCEQEGNITAQSVIEAFEAFAQRYSQSYEQTKQPCIVLVDNAPAHTCNAFLNKIEEWFASGVIVHFLPSYSPELNFIEILWRKVKYEWLSFNAYLDFISLKSEVLSVLNQVGEKYTITFA